MSLDYSNFSLLDDQRKEKDEKIKQKQRIRQNKINRIVECNDLILLKNDYYNSYSYYYSKKYDKMYVVSNVEDNDEEPIFQVSTDCRIMMLNNICNNKCLYK